MGDLNARVVVEKEGYKNIMGGEGSGDTMRIKIYYWIYGEFTNLC